VAVPEATANPGEQLFEFDGDLFETEDQARTATPPATAWSAPGVTILRADIRRIAVAIP